MKQTQQKHAAWMESLSKTLKGSLSRVHHNRLLVKENIHFEEIYGQSKDKMFSEFDKIRKSKMWYATHEAVRVLEECICLQNKC